MVDKTGSHHFTVHITSGSAASYNLAFSGENVTWAIRSQCGCTGKGASVHGVPAAVRPRDDCLATCCREDEPLNERVLARTMNGLDDRGTTVRLLHEQAVVRYVPVRERGCDRTSEPRRMSGHRSKRRGTLPERLHGIPRRRSGRVRPGAARRRTPSAPRISRAVSRRIAAMASRVRAQARRSLAAISLSRAPSERCGCSMTLDPTTARSVAGQPYVSELRAAATGRIDLGDPVHEGATA